MDAEQAWERIKRGETGEKFAAFYDLLSFYNKKFNLTRITDRILKEVKGVNRVLYDLSPKPVATIEWE